MSKDKKTPAPGLGDLLKLALAQRGGVPKKPHKAPSRQFRRATQLCGGRRRD
ncbi:MAG: hypothetical protein HY941_07185 [Gammaproteobacteria bacterium]|nr:hypothetical protein [Gammaproteobacteria bacterium]